MADRVFCIDFGSSFTKVALRRDPGADAVPLRPDFTMAGVVDFCIPSAVGIEKHGTRNMPLFGAKAMACRPPLLHANWKRRVFSAPDPEQPAKKLPLDAFLESSELLELATKYGVTSGQMVQLQNLVANARALAGGPVAAPVSAEAQNRTIASSLAYNFFRWLREEVLKAAARLKLDGLDPAAIPARITVPAFTHGKELEQHPGTQLLLNALGRAGWPIHTDRPVVSEPYSNAIGVLTNATNVVQKARRIHLGKMFGKGPIITVLKDPVNHPTYRALVVDVGAYTTDFATVTLNPEGKTVDDPDIAISVRQRSAQVGVSDYDARVFDALPSDKRGWLANAQPADLESFRKLVYSDGKPYRTVEVGAIGGTADMEAIRAGTDAFLHQLSVEAMKFCDDLEPVKHQELILTGGGSNVPRIRDALTTAAKSNGRSFFRTHAPGLKKSAADGPVNPLKDEMSRGGSALGGASIYYEREYY